MRSRFELDKMLALFDFPDPNNHASGRVKTTTPLQKMFVLNSPFMVQQAQRVADRIAVEAGDDLKERISRLYTLLFARPPAADELATAERYLATDSDERWVEFTHALLASNEMLILD
jgi:hypothetical protein